MPGTAQRRERHRVYSKLQGIEEMVERVVDWVSPEGHHS